MRWFIKRSDQRLYAMMSYTESLDRTIHVIVTPKNCNNYGKYRFKVLSFYNKHIKHRKISPEHAK